MTKFPRHDQSGWFPAVKTRISGSYATVDFDTSQMLKKIEMEVCAAELAIGDGTEAGIDLLLDNVGDPFVFKRSEIGFARLAFGYLFSGRKNVFGSQKGAHLISSVDTCWEWHLRETTRVIIKVPEVWSEVLFRVRYCSAERHL